MNIDQKLTDVLQDREPPIMGHERCFKTSVVLPLMFTESTDPTVEDGWSVLFQKRADHLENQPGEICFPGGKMEAEDATHKDTAIRETTEELRISRSELEIIGPLDRMVLPWQMMLYPHVGKLTNADNIDPDPDEVDEVFSVKLQSVLRTEPEFHTLKLDPNPADDFPFEKIPGGRDYSWTSGVLPEVFYEFDNEVVWGITARILYNFVELLQE